MTQVFSGGTGNGRPPARRRRPRLVRLGPGGEALGQAVSTTAASPPWKPPERPLGCAIIGLGARGASFARRLSRFQGIELKWLADLSQDRLAACVEGLTSAAPRLSRDVTHVLGDPTVEAVFVTVPDFLHRQMAVAAFAAGKHVFLEKPLATTLADALAIIDAWQAPVACSSWAMCCARRPSIAPRGPWSPRGAWAGSTPFA